MDLWNTSNSTSDEAGVDSDGSTKKRHLHEHSKKASKKHHDKKTKKKNKSHRSSDKVEDDRKLNSQAHDAANDSLGDVKGKSGIDERTSRTAFLSRSSVSSSFSSTGVVPAASWRGNRDPVLSQQSALSSSSSIRPSSSIKGTDISSQKPRQPMDSTLSGIGGLGRHR